MVDSRRVFTVISSSSQRAGSAWRTVSRQPNWVVRAAAIAFLVVIGVPIVLLILAAAVVAGLVLGVLILVNAAWMRLRGLLPRNDGRQNVRVIRRP